MNRPPLPKEHGSWAMLIVPLLLGLASAPVWRWRAVALLLAALGFFLMRYPLATLVKTRRRRSTDRAYLWRWAAIYGGIVLLAGGWLVLAQGLWWLAAMGIVGGLLVAFHLWLVARRQEMSVVGELSGILGLALGAPMAYYTAGSQLDRAAAVLWLINALYFGGTVFYIKLKVRQQPRQPRPQRPSQRLIRAGACLTYQTVALSVVIVLAALRQAPVLVPLAFVPVTVKVLWGAWHWQDKKSLSLVRLGVAEIAHAVAFAGLVIVAFR
ncbi:MAG: YwiC-like family protein [Anaerolineae bacterium]